MAKHEIKEILQLCRDQGCTVEITCRGHIKVVPGDKTKQIVVTSGTPSDHRAILNFVGRLRRSGVNIP